MYFILNGECLMIGEQNTTEAELTKNSVFGVRALLDESGQFSSSSIVA
jgi:hypothetical protein